MPDFPAAPVSPSELLERYLPAAFAASGDRGQAAGLDVQLGVALLGEGGGEWIVHLDDGSMRVSAAPRRDTAFTYVQTVKDWRGALWEGRGGAMGAQTSTLFRPGSRAAAGAGGPGAIAATPAPAVLEQLRSLDGLIRVVVTGGEGGDWAVGFKLGPGAIPDEATTTVTVSSEDAEAMGRGELNAMEAFMAGRIQVAGDMTLMLQMQAIQMQAAASAAGS
jgi:hypothetical protein